MDDLPSFQPPLSRVISYPFPTPLLQTIHQVLPNYGRLEMYPSSFQPQQPPLVSPAAHFEGLSLAQSFFNPTELAWFQGVNLYEQLGGLANNLWVIWELLVTGESFLVVSNDPHQCSQTVLALVGSVLCPVAVDVAVVVFWTASHSVVKVFSDFRVFSSFPCSPPRRASSAPCPSAETSGPISPSTTRTAVTTQPYRTQEQLACRHWCWG